jgi:hypothetical protein
LLNEPFKVKDDDAKRKAQSAERKRKNRPVGASSACDETYGRNFSYRNEDIAPAYLPKLSALCALRFAIVSLTSRRAWGIKFTSFYAATAGKLAVCLFGSSVKGRCAYG